MNQNSRKIAKTKVEKEFYKLLNNSTFGNDCRNNICNYKLGLMFDGLDEIRYIKKFTNIMQDSRYREFFSLDLLGQQVETEYNQNREKLDEDNPFHFAILESYEWKKEEDLEAIECFTKKKKRKHNTQTVVDAIEKKLIAVQT